MSDSEQPEVSGEEGEEISKDVTVKIKINIVVTQNWLLQQKDGVGYTVGWWAPWSGTTSVHKYDICDRVVFRETWNWVKLELDQSALCNIFIFLRTEKKAWKALQNQQALFKLLFRCPFGKNESACSFLVSLLNVGRRVASSYDNFLIFGATCDENSPVTKKYVGSLLPQITVWKSWIWIWRHKI